MLVLCVSGRGVEHTGTWLFSHPHAWISAGAAVVHAEKFRIFFQADIHAENMDVLVNQPDTRASVARWGTLSGGSSHSDLWSLFCRLIWTISLGGLSQGTLTADIDANSFSRPQVATVGGRFNWGNGRIVCNHMGLQLSWSEGSKLVFWVKSEHQRRQSFAVGAGKNLKSTATRPQNFNKLYFRLNPETGVRDCPLLQNATGTCRPRRFNMTLGPCPHICLAVAWIWLFMWLQRIQRNVISLNLSQLSLFYTLRTIRPSNGNNGSEKINLTCILALCPQDIAEGKLLPWQQN